MANQDTFDFDDLPLALRHDAPPEHLTRDMDTVPPSPAAWPGSIPGAAPFLNEEGVSTWNEVPAALFLSWSDPMQRAYCRNRDLDAALHADSLEWIEFYQERAEKYT